MSSVVPSIADDESGKCGTALLRVESLTKEFMIHERRRKISAFNSISFSARAGELLALVGSSGSGKSSVLKCIYRTYLPTGGKILYTTRDGELVDLAAIDDARMLGLRRNEIRFVSQFLRVVPRRSALQIVEHVVRQTGRTDKDFLRAAKESLQRVGLPDALWDLAPNTFSGGEKQLVNLAQALAIKPRLLLLDEPTASLDPTSTDKVLTAIEELKSSDLAIVGVFHDRRIIERLADQQVQLAGGLSGDNSSHGDN